MATEPIEPATIYLAAVLIVFGVWFIGDRVWAVAHTIVVERRKHRGVTVKLVSAVVGAMIAVMSWKVAPTLASVVPQQDRTIVQVEQVRDASGVALSLRTLMSSDVVMLGGAARPTQGSYVVVPGDCLWKIARSLLAADGLSVTGTATSALWRSIYEMNRELIGPNPNLIFPGQELVLPER
ncbi:MAG: LysM domain-containing protein [Armatimonadetes bacterium]|nr:MAG: LysM domain-containing protein [Armatimonadota bacterium]